VCLSIELFKVASFPCYSSVIWIIVFPIHALLICASQKLCCVLCFPSMPSTPPFLVVNISPTISCLCGSCGCRWCLRIFNWDAPLKLTTLRILFFHICLSIFWVLVLLYVFSLYVFFFWFFVWFWFLLVFYMCFVYICVVFHFWKTIYFDAN